VTVLFAEVKGPMDLAERVDPEEWHGIMDGFFPHPEQNGRRDCSRGHTWNTSSVAHLHNVSGS
jgi:hypothetical protein